MGILNRLNAYFSCKDAYTELEWHNHLCHKRGELEGLIIEKQQSRQTGGELWEDNKCPRYPGRWKSK